MNELKLSLKTTIKNDSVVKMVMDRIKEAIINKELKPGDKLPPVMQISDNFGVGVSSVREAVKMLQAIGVVEPKQGEGTYIRESISDESINPLIFQMILENGKNDDLLELRMMFETAYTIIAMRDATQEDYQAMEAAIENQSKMISLHNFTADDDICFHRAVLRATHNPYIIKIGETILQLIKATFMQNKHGKPEFALYDHRKIYNAIRQKDERNLRNVLEESFALWRESVLKNRRL